MNKQLSKLDYGKLPPSDIDVEKAVIGSILSEPKALLIASRILQPEHFYKLEHQLIYRSILSVMGNSRVDILTVSADLREKGEFENVGGAFYVSQLINSIASTANVEVHCRIVAQKYMLREVISINSKAINLAYAQSEDPFELVSQNISEIHNISKGLLSKRDKTTAQYLNELEENVDKNLAGLIPGIPTGVNKYDKSTGGHGKTDLIIYAGRPGMGKTARMCNEIYHQLSKGLGVIIHTMEMSGSQLLARIIGLHIGIPPRDIAKRKINKKMFLKGKEWVLSKNIKIFESNNLESIILESHLYQSTRGCDIVYIDYLQLIDAGKSSEFDNVTQASKDMKRLAKEMNVPVVALAQLSRSVETRGGDKRPIISDLRQSGQIEQDADVVEFLYRPEQYGINEFELDGEIISTAGKTFYINAKYRSDEPGITTVMYWNGPLNKLSETQEYIPIPIIENKMPVGVGFDDDNPF